MQSIHAEEMIEQKLTVRKANTRWQRTVFLFMDSAQSQLFLMGLLLLSLFLADSWVCGNAPDSENNALYAILTAIFIIFMIETTVLCFVQPKYFLGFFFWMDLIGTLSILLDIGWVSDSFLPQGGTRHKGSILRATRAAKLGARYGRLMRLLRLIRFANYIPCLAQPEKEEQEPSMASVRKISRELNALLTKQIAALVMLLVIIVPFLSYTVTDNSTNAFLISIANLAYHNASYSELDSVVGDMKSFYNGNDNRAMYLTINTPFQTTPYHWDFDERDVIRKSNTVLYTKLYGYNGVNYEVRCLIDATVPNQWDSMFGIVLIVLVIGCLTFFSATFAAAIDGSVVGPLNKMMLMLRDSATIMLKSVKAMSDSEEFKDKEGIAEDSLDDEIESQLLEKMIEKLVRVMKHVVPNSGIEISLNADVDKATASWLNSNFSTAAEKRAVEVVEIDEEAERIRLLELASSQTIVSAEVLNSWDFDVLLYSNEECSEVITYVFSICNFIEEFKVPLGVFKEFIREVSSSYINTNTYHNYRHGCDVCHTVYRLVVIPQLNLTFSQLEFFSLLIAALAHDIGHPGINNLYLTKSRHALAIQHNDRSPLESMHCATLYEILSKPATNILSTLTDGQWRESRKIILACILGTDMSHHFEQISKTQLFLEVNGEDTKKFCRGEKDTIDCFSDDSNRLFVMELFLHCADISNPYKPWNICTKWTALVVEEFCLQGDREKKEGLEVSPMCDRDTIILCNMQMGFIEFVVAPLISAVVNVFPPLFEMSQFLTNNFCSWGERRKDEFMAMSDSVMEHAARVEECRKLDERMGKFRDKTNFVQELRQQPKRRSNQVNKAALKLMK